MALTEEQKQRARAAGAQNAELIRQGAFTNQEVRARDEASRVRIPTSGGIKTGREIMGQFGSLFNVWGDGGTGSYVNDRNRENEENSPGRLLTNLRNRATQAGQLYQQHLQQKPEMRTITGWDGAYLGTEAVDQNAYEAWSAREQTLREDTQRWQGLADMLQQEDLIENIDRYAAQAEQEYQDYIHSESFVSGSRARAQERDERIRMAAAMGADPAYMALFSWEDKDETEETLRATAAYYRSLADAKKDSGLMEADMQELAIWPDEDQQLLALYAVNRVRDATLGRGQDQFYNFPTAQGEAKALFDKYGAQKVNEMAESYLRYMNQQNAQVVQEKAQDIGLPAQAAEGELTPEETAIQVDLQTLSGWSPSEQKLLAQYAADPENAEKQGKLLFDKFGKDTVIRIAASYTKSLALQQEAAASAAEPTKRSGWAMTGHSAASVGANLLGGLTGPLGYLVEGSTATGRYTTLDPNNAGMLPSTYAGAVRQTVSEELRGRNHGNLKATVYQAGMSALDNLARIVVGGKSGSLALAATGSFGSAVQEYSRQGVDPVRAIAMGVFRGAIEVVTEKFSLDNLLENASTPKKLGQMLWAAFRGGGFEVTEEEFGLVLTTFLEAGLLREDSSYNRRVAELQAYGLSPEQAREQAAYALLEEALNTGVQSFLSGGMMSGATSVYAKAVDTLTSGKDGKTPQQTAERGQGYVYAVGTEVGPQLMEAAERISRATGRSIQFYSSDQGEDGFYDANNGVLHVNTKGVDPFAQIVSHELTHSIEGSAMYQQLSNLVLQRIRQTGGNLEQLREEKAALYRKNGKVLKDQTAVDREIVASYVSSYLLTKESEITSLVQENPSLGRRILNWLNDMWAKLGSRSAQEREFIRRARDLYARALDQTSGTGNVSDSGTAVTGDQATGVVSDSGTNAAPVSQGQNAQQPAVDAPVQDGSLEATDRWMQEQLRTGAITEEEYDAYLEERDQYDQQRGVDRMQEEDKRFYGEQGRQYSFKGYSEDGRGIYESNFPKGTPKKAKGERILRYIQDVWSKNPITLRVDTVDGVKYIEAQFDPEYDEKDGYQSDASKLMGGNKHGNKSEQRVTLDLADDYYQIASESVHNYSKEETGKDSKTHDDVKTWHYFINDILFQEYGESEMKPYRVSINIKEKPNGHFVYSFSAERQSNTDGKQYSISEKKEKSSTRRTLHADVTSADNSGSNAQLSNNSIDKDGRDVNRKYSVSENSISRDQRNKGDTEWEQAHNAAKAAGYPVLKGEQIIPYKTWVRAEDRKNYGLVIGRASENRLMVNFVNKEEGYNKTVAMPYDLLTPVPGVRQMTKEEYDSLMRSPAEDPNSHTLTEEEQREVEELLQRAGVGSDNVPQDPFDERADGNQTDQKTDVPREIIRENLNTKAANKLRHEETVLLNKIGQALGVPYHAKKDTLKPMIQEMSDEYLRTGMISEETKTRIFEAAYEEGIVIDREFYDQYKHIKDHLRTTAITLSKQDRSDVTDYGRLRRDANRNKLLRITEDGGLPVDTFYQEMREMAPELFPAEYTHPADQLQRLFDISQSIVVTETSLNDYYGPLAAEYKAGDRADFEDQLAKSIPELNKVRRYGEDRLLSKDDTDPISVEEAEEIGHKLKQARRNYEKVNAKHLLTAHDEMQVGRLLRGETQLEYLQKEENFDSIKAVFEAKREYEDYAQLLGRYKRQVRKQKLDLADKYLQTANTWKDKKSGILYSRETMRRNIFDIIPDDPELAAAIVEEYFEPVHRAEAASTRFKQEYRDRVKALGLSRKVNKGDLVSEAHAVQLLGEAADNIRVIENSRGRIKTRDGKTLLEWQAVVQNLWAENPGLDKSRVENAVLEFRKIYDELFQKMNRARLENGYEPVSYRQGYFPHFQPGDGDGIMHYFGRILGIDVSVDNLPTTINGLTHTFKPGIQWMGNAQERLGFNTAYDAVEGFDKYIEGVSSVIHQTENIQKLRALGTQARYRTSDEGLREQVDAIQRDTRLTDEERQMKIRDIYEHGKFSLSNFVVELDEYTNLLANKKSAFDRGIERAIGRKWYTIMKRVESQVGANMIAGNISSAFTNFIPLTQAMGHIGMVDMRKGVRDTVLAVFHKDRSIVGQSDFLTNRRGSDVLVKAWMDKLSGTLGTPMEIIDNIVSESIVRGAYYQNLKRGLSESEAMHQADITASGIMADRSKGALPTLFESSNPLIKLFTQFQVEVNNQYSEMFKDMPREYKDRAKTALAWAFIKYFLAAWLWNELEEKLKGRRSALDPIDALHTFYTDWKDAGAADAIGNLSVNLLEGLPFTSALSLVGVDIDAGRVPVASALPDLSAMGKALLGRDIPGNVRVRTLTQELQKPITYLLMPAGGGQLAKAWKGISAYMDGGSYSLNQDGEEILQYPIFRDTPLEGAGNLVKSVLFGKSSLGTAQDWVNSGFDSLNAVETAIYQDLISSGAGEREAYEALRRVQAVPQEDSDLVENAADVRRQNQTNLILNDTLSPEAQAILFYGVVATESEQKMMDRLVEAGSEYDGMVKFVSSLYDIKLWEEDKKSAYRDLLASSGLTEEEKIVAVGEILGTEETTETGNLSLYGKFKLAVEDGMSVDNFMKIYAAGASIDRYFEMDDAGIRQDETVNLVIEMSDLKPLRGAKSVSWYQECDVILGSRLSAPEQVRALQVVCNESTGAKIRIGYDNGLPPGALVYLKQILPEFDANANGSYTQKEVTAAIDAVSGDDNLIYTLTGTSPHGFRLSNEQKAVLWQLQTGAKNGRGNPYSVEIGKMVYDMVQADKEAREEK